MLISLVKYLNEHNIRYAEIRSLLELPNTADAVYDMDVAFKTKMQDFHYKNLKFHSAAKNQMLY
ncbi:hypothetical protein B9T33_11035 [Acinetobacter sp. ANC 5054]|nr:hypothetical protein B9T33_11035 [Acinetobacter sp. ANC 5054]